jgi:aminomethyltransferase
MGGDLKRTPLFAEHQGSGAKLVDFNHWEMPVQYQPGILKEHETVRTTAGLFDVSHMGRFEIDGPGAVAFINHLVTNDVEKAADNQLLYTPMCNERGTVLDDVTVYRMPDRILLVANAGNLERIWNWLEKQAAAWSGGSVRLRNRSEELAQIAFQGPRTEELFAPMVDADLKGLGYYRHLRAWVNGVPGVVVSRNGYTGEDGFEIYLPRENAVALWRALLAAGKDLQVTPIGLGARDTLRLEMTYALYGNELDLETTPMEAGLQWTVKLKKADFVGKPVLERQKAEGVAKSIIGFAVEGNRMPRHGMPIMSEGKQVGVVTSGGFCPSLKIGMGLGYAPPALSAVGTRLQVDVRGALVPAQVVERPFYKNASHK